MRQFARYRPLGVSTSRSASEMAPRSVTLRVAPGSATVTLDPRMPSARSAKTIMVVTVFMVISLVLIFGDLNCCVAIARARFVVGSQSGPVDLGDRRPDGGLHALPEAHLAGEVAGIERSADSLGRALE